MIILLLIGLGLTVLSVALILRAFGFARGRSASTVDSIDAYGFTGRTEAVLLRSRRKARASVDDYVTKLDKGGLYVDVKCQADAAQFRARGVNVWRL